MGVTAEVDASMMKDASGTFEEASPAPGYNDGLNDGALPETELTAEDRSVRRRHITTSAAVEAKTLFTEEDPDLIYESATAPSSTYPLRPEHMMDTAVSVDRGVVIHVRKCRPLNRTATAGRRRRRAPAQLL